MFQRVKKQWNPEAQKEETLTVFTSHRGIGVTVPDPEEFAKQYIDVSQDLKKEFDLDYSAPFFSSACLRDHLPVLLQNWDMLWFGANRPVQPR